MLRRTFNHAGTAILLGLGLLGPGGASTAALVEPGELRPPAVPLVACDPYFSVWSFSDRLTDGYTRHWTGRKQSLSSMIRVDGKVYRLMGDEPSDVPPLPQVGLRVLPTRTIYDFQGSETQVTLTFMTAALPCRTTSTSSPGRSRT